VRRLPSELLCAKKAGILSSLKEISMSATISLKKACMHGGNNAKANGADIRLASC